MLWDTGRPYHYFRWVKNRRVLFGGADRPAGAGRSRRRMNAAGEAALVDRLKEWYPVLADTDVTHAWEGLFAQTPDGLPYVGPHRRYPRHLFALGYGGNGMSVSYLAARILLRHFQGTATRDDQLFGFSR
jgi:glycine/D-amino acid oxidase-like deaminating enzyme